MKKHSLLLVLFTLISVFIGCSIKIELLNNLLTDIILHLNSTFEVGLILQTVLAIGFFIFLLVLALNQYQHKTLVAVNIILFSIFIYIGRWYNHYKTGGFLFFFCSLVLLIFAYKLFNYLISNKTSKSAIFNDSLGRKEFTIKLVNHLMKIREKNAFNVALLGEWGSGKTYLMEFIKEELSRRLDTIVVEFTPWSIENMDSIELELLKAVRNSSEGDLENDISDLIDLLNTDNENSVFKTITFGFLKYFKKTEKEIIQSIKRELSNKKLFVFLDDLDRLEPVEMDSVMRALRNTLNYPNVHFIVGFDEEHVLSILNIEKKSRSKYLDKFFQIRIQVPVVKDVQEYFKEKFREKFKGVMFDINTDEYNVKFWSLVGSEFLSEIDNLRTVDSVLNNFNLVYEILQNDTDSFTLLQLEILRNKYADLYLKFSQDKSYLHNFIDLRMVMEGEENNLIKQIKISSAAGKFKITDPNYLYNYFIYIPDENQVPLMLIKKYLEQNNKPKLTEFIQDGKGIDVFTKIQIIIENEDVEMNNSTIELIIELYAIYAPSPVMPYRPLIKHSMKKNEGKNTIVDYLMKSNPKHIIYIINLISMTKGFSWEDILLSFQEYTQSVKTFPKKSLSTVLTEIYLIQSRHNLIGTIQGNEINSKIDKILSDLYNANPLSFLENMVMPISELFDGIKTYTIMNNFIPDKISYEQAFNIIDLIIDDEIEKKKAEEFKLFLQHRESNNYKNPGRMDYTDFLFIHNSP
jgi:hypothetical protein